MKEKSHKGQRHKGCGLCDQEKRAGNAADRRPARDRQHGPIAGSERLSEAAHVAPTEADRPLDVAAILRRQLERYGPELLALESEGGDEDVPPAHGSLTNEQLAQARAQLDRVWPGIADWFLDNYQGPMPRPQLDALDDIPPGFPGTKEDFVTQHEVMRVLLGDLRPRPKVPDGDRTEQLG